MYRAADKSLFNNSIDRVHNQIEYEDCCEILRSLLRLAEQDIATALDGYLSSIYLFSTKRNMIVQIKQKSILNMMKEMKNPPSKHKDAYKALLALYDEYNDFSSLVINPTGSLQSFTEEFNEADKSLADYCDKIKMYID